MKPGDLVEADDEVGIIIEKYDNSIPDRNGCWDWEVYLLKKKFQDCYKESSLKLSKKKVIVPEKILNLIIAKHI